MWIREGRDEEHEVPKLTVLDDGSLFLSDVEKNDSGVYSCTANDSDTEDDSIAKMEVFVRSESFLFNLDKFIFSICCKTGFVFIM